jgi:ADP-heptose:LPS heptosyltransferase
MVGQENPRADSLAQTPPTRGPEAGDVSDLLSVPAPRRVLIIKPSALGDVVTALPVLHGLRRSFPSAHIAWLVRDLYAPLLAGLDGLDEIITYDRALLGRFWWPGRGAAHALRLRRQLRDGGFDWALDLQGLLRSGLFAWMTGATVRAGFADAREGAPAFYTHRLNLPVAEFHTVQRNIELARRLGVDARAEDFRMSVPAGGVVSAGRLLASKGLLDRPFVVCVIPTTWATKRYPVDRWQRVIRQVGQWAPVAVLGTPADRELCASACEGTDAAVNLAGQTDLPALAGVLAGARGVICCDSAAKFIAQAVGTPVVCLIGPTLAERTGPFPLAPTPGRCVVSPAACQGCLKKRCRHGTCMHLIRPTEVVDAVRPWFEGAAGPCLTGTTGES